MKLLIGIRCNDSETATEVMKDFCDYITTSGKEVVECNIEESFDVYDIRVQLENMNDSNVHDIKNWLATNDGSEEVLILDGLFFEELSVEYSFIVVYR